MNIPPLDLKRQYKQIEKEVLAEISRICKEQSFILGKAVSDFEAHIARYCGTKYAVGCASGTDAIKIALKVCGIGQGDEVIVPSFTFIASAEPIATLGAKPVFCDIDPKTYNIDPKAIEDKVTKKTKAVIVVHLYGQTADMKPILSIARKYKLKVIEDSCQAIGAVYGPYKKKAGSMSDFGCFSFFPSKNLGGFGDGGIIVTNNKRAVEEMKMLRQHGSRKKYYHDCLGFNSRLDALQAVVLDVKLKYLDRWLKGRNRVADEYSRLLKKALGDNVIVPYTEKNNYHTYHQYVIGFPKFSKKKRDALLAYMQKNGVGVNVYYPEPCHLQKCFSYLKYKKGSLPHTEKKATETMSLPIYPEITKKEQQYIVNHIVKGLNSL